jgi:hypothetical protein
MAAVRKGNWREAGARVQVCALPVEYQAKGAAFHEPCSACGTPRFSGRQLILARNLVDSSGSQNEGRACLNMIC